MVDFEKGTAAWDVGMILTRHRTAHPVCDKVGVLRRSALSGMTAEARFQEAHKAACTCGMGHSDSEETSLNPPKRQDRSD